MNFPKNTFRAFLPMVFSFFFVKIAFPQNDCRTFEDQAQNNSGQPAIELWEKAADCYHGNEAYVDWLFCLRTAGTILSGDGFPDEALSLLLPALEEANKRKEHLYDETFGEFYIQLGYLSKRVGDHYQAKQFYEKAIVIHERKGILNNSGAYLYKPMANIYTRLGDNEKAIVLLNQALDSCKVSGAWDDVIEVYCELGIAYWDAEEIGKAVENFDEGLALVNEFLKDYPGQPALQDLKGILYSAKARALLEEGRVPVAAALTENAIGLIQDPRQQAQNYTLKAEILVEQERYSEALGYYQRAFDLDTSTYANHNRREVAKNEIGMAEVTLQRLQYDETLDYCQRALRRLIPKFVGRGRYPDPDPQYFIPEVAVLEALIVKAQALYAQAKTEADLEAVLSTLKVTIQLEDQLRETYSYQSAQFQNLSESRDVYELLMLSLYEKYHRYQDEDVLEDAFKYLEKSRAVLLNASLREDRAMESNLSVEEYEILKDLKVQMSFYKTLLFEVRTANEQEQVNELANKIDRIKATYDRKIDSLAAANRSFSRSISESILSLQQVRSRLQNDALILEYFYGTDAIYVMAISRNEVIFDRLEMPEDMGEIIKTYTEVLQDWNIYAESGRESWLFDRYSKHGKRMYDLLIAAYIQSGSFKSLVFVPDGVLNYFPFDLSLQETFQGPALAYGELPYLVRDYNVLQATSVSTLWGGVQKRKRTKRAEMDYLGVAPDYANCSLQQVAGGKRVVREMEKMFTGRTLLGNQALMKTFKEIVKQYRIVHFHGHAKALTQNPEFSWLAFTHTGEPTRPVAGPGGKASRTPNDVALLGGNGEIPVERARLMYAQEIPGLDLIADLVVLSACETGSGEIAAGEGQLSLARSFLLAGCPSLLMSLWEAEDKATATLMKAFFNHLKNGDEKAEALRKAKLEYLANGENVYPAFWAGFTLIGNNDAIFRTGSWYHPWIYVIGGLVLFLLWWRRNKLTFRSLS